MDLVSLSVLRDHHQTTKMLANVGILNFGDLAIFRKFYVTKEDEFREAKKIGIVSENYQKFLIEVHKFTQKAEKFTLFDEPPFHIKYAKLIIDRKAQSSDLLIEQLNTLICSRSLNLISGWKGSGKANFW